MLFPLPLLAAVLPGSREEGYYTGGPPQCPDGSTCPDKLPRVPEPRLFSSRCLGLCPLGEAPRGQMGPMPSHTHLPQPNRSKESSQPIPKAQQARNSFSSLKLGPVLTPRPWSAAHKLCLSTGCAPEAGQGTIQSLALRSVPEVTHSFQSTPLTGQRRELELREGKGLA